METPPITPAPEEAKKNNTLLYIIIGAIVLCGCCSVALGAWWLWNNGDALIQGVNLLMPFLG